MTPESNKLLRRLVFGRLSIAIPDLRARCIAEDIAGRAADLIEREVDWVHAGMHPTLKPSQLIHKSRRWRDKSHA